MIKYRTKILVQLYLLVYGFLLFSISLWDPEVRIHSGEIEINKIRQMIDDRLKRKYKM